MGEVRTYLLIFLIDLLPEPRAKQNKVNQNNNSEKAA